MNCKNYITTTENRELTEKEGIDPLTNNSIGAAIEVHRALGPGLLESAYEACLLHELCLRRMKVEHQKPLPIFYKDVILEHENDIKDVMTPSQIKDASNWFDDETCEDKDFPSGYAIGTEVYINPEGKTQCVFKDDNNYCSIQVMAVKKNKHKWQFKPLHCILYPLTIVENTLMYDEDHSQELDYCGVNHPENFTQPVFEAMHEEIKYIIGIEGFNFLNDYYIKNYKKKYQIDIPDFELELINKR